MLALTPLGILFERNVGLSWLFGIRGAVAPPPEVVVVAVDSTTGPALNLPRLPRDWPRTIHAQLVETLVSRGASVIIFDMDFSRAGSAYEDASFARAIQNARRVVLFERLDSKRQTLQGLGGVGPGVNWIEEKQVGPAAQLAAAARAVAPFPLPKIESATFEFWTFKSSLGDVPTMPAAALQLEALSVYDDWMALLGAAGVPGIKDLPSRVSGIQSPQDLEALMANLYRTFREEPAVIDDLTHMISQTRMGPDRSLLLALLSLYANDEHRYLNFYGPPGTLRRIPYQALLGSVPKIGEDGFEELDGAAVFVGYSDLNDPDQPDGVYTVFTDSKQIDLAGVEIMATSFANLLEDRALRPLGYLPTVLIHTLFGFLLGSSIYVLPAPWSVPLAFAFSAAYSAAAQLSFTQSDVWLPVAVPILLQLPCSLLMGLMGQYLIERRREQRMRNAISYYLPSSIVEDLSERHIDPKSVRKVAYGVCFATDMAGFSSIAENRPPGELATFMNSYFEALAQPLKHHGVNITEFRADAIMCAWIADDSRSMRANAVRAAIDVVEAVQLFSSRNAPICLTPRVGLQDGEFYVGHTGGGGRMVYSIVGDTANTASRLESLNKHLETNVLAAASVVLGVDDCIQRFMGFFRFVGRADATPVIELMARESDPLAKEALLLCDRFAEALEVFHSRHWTEAADQFQAILEDHPHDGPSRFYLKRSRRNALDDADVDDAKVIRMDTK